MLKKIPFLWCVYSFSLFNNLVLIYPVYSIVFQEKGLSVAQIGTALMWWSVSVILLQIPVGIFSDRLSRRNMLVFGNIIAAIAFFIFMIRPTFIGVLCGFGLWGLKWAIDAACFQPMVYDNIRNKKKYLSIVGTCNSLKLIGLALSSLCSFLIFLGYDFLSWCTIGFMLLGIIVLMEMPRDVHVKNRKTTKPIRLNDIKAATSFVFMRPQLLGIMGLIAILDACGNMDEWLGLIALQLGYPEYAVGVLFFAALICGAAGGIAVRWIKHVNETKVPIMIALSGILLVMTAIWYNVWATVLMCLLWFLLSMCGNIVYASFQRNVSSTVRGRATSLLEILMNVATLFVYGTMTIGGTLGGEYKYSLFALGVLLLIASLYRFGFKNTKIKVQKPANRAPRK